MAHLVARLTTTAGKQFEVLLTAETEFSPSSLTDKTVHRLPLNDNNSFGILFIQGDKIDNIEILREKR